VNIATVTGLAMSSGAVTDRFETVITVTVSPGHSSKYGTCWAGHHGHFVLNLISSSVPHGVWF